MHIRRWIPRNLKRAARLLQRRWRDGRNGDARRLAPGAAATDSGLAFSAGIELVQPVLPAALLDNKLHNLRLAADAIAGRPIFPGEIFSFWHWVGSPTARRGFKTGRNIVGTVLREEVGGGLCQMATMLYHLALLAGLDVRERHAHTYDIYWDDDTRYTPLGSDATVVFGYKDLRFVNNLVQPVRFRFLIEKERFTAWLEAPGALKQHALQFDCEEREGLRWVRAIDISGGGKRLLATSCYQKMPGQ